MTVDPSAARVASALDALAVVLDSMTPERLARQTSDGKWAAQENLAHLGRYQHLFRHDRIRRILTEDTAAFPRYRAENDPEWEACRTRPLGEIINTLRSERRELSNEMASWGRGGVEAPRHAPAARHAHAPAVDRHVFDARRASSLHRPHSKPCRSVVELDFEFPICSCGRSPPERDL